MNNDLRLKDIERRVEQRLKKLDEADLVSTAVPPLKQSVSKGMLKKVADIMQDANEMGGPEGDDFIFLMRTIARMAIEQHNTAVEHYENVYLGVNHEPDPKALKKIKASIS